jgi:hypothetical protein
MHRYRNVELKATVRILFSSQVEAFQWILPHINKKAGPLTEGHNSYPWEFQQTVGRPDHQQLNGIVDEKLQHHSVNF